jgi:D-alanine transaminase
MSRTVYLNGEYVPEEEAKISVFDRGFYLPTRCMKSRRW